MADVSIYVAVITGAAAAGVVGAAVPQVASVYRDVRQANRDRQDRADDARRQACLDLLRVAGELRTQVANNREYYGPEMRERLADVRKSAAAARLHAVEVSLRAPDRLAVPAERVAAAAERLAVAAAEHTNLGQGVMTDLPSFSDLDRSVREFRREVVTEAGSRSSEADPGSRPEAEG